MTPPRRVASARSPAPEEGPPRRVGVAWRHRAAPALRRRVRVVCGGRGGPAFCTWRVVSPGGASADWIRVAGAEVAGRTGGLSKWRVRVEAVVDPRASHGRRGRERELDAALRAPTARGRRFPEEGRGLCEDTWAAVGRTRGDSGRRRVGLRLFPLRGPLLTGRRAGSHGAGTGAAPSS